KFLITENIYRRHSPGKTVNGCRISVERNGGGNGGSPNGSSPFELEDGGEIIEFPPKAAITCKRPTGMVYYL
uniref:Uncharacterized protein n=1 Tax=Megaselia scalaris TaxID=36166 RepID=T1H6T1_MEGSC